MRAKGFTIIELMITVAIIGIITLIAIPLYRNYVARVEITNIKQAYMYIGGDINTAYMSSNMEGHSYNVDELIKKAPNTYYSQWTHNCYGGFRGYEISWTDKPSIEKVTGMSAKHIKQFGLNLYRQMPKGMTNSSCSITTTEEGHFQQTVFFALDETTLGYPKKKQAVATGRYLSNLLVVTFSGKNTYYDKDGKELRTAANGSPTCGIAYDVGLESLVDNFDIPMDGLPQECKYMSIWHSTESRRILHPL